MNIGGSQQLFHHSSNVPFSLDCPDDLLKYLHPMRKQVSKHISGQQC